MIIDVEKEINDYAIYGYVVYNCPICDQHMRRKMRFMSYGETITTSKCEWCNIEYKIEVLSGMWTTDENADTY